MTETRIDEGHTLRLDNRNRGLITGVTDVIAFDEKEIQLKTQDGTMTINGTSLTLTRLDLEHGEADILGRVDSVNYSKEKKKQTRPVKRAVWHWW